MSHFSESDLLEIFAFIDSDTISDGNWLKMNLTRHCLKLGVPAIQLGYRTHNTLKEQFVHAILSSSQQVSCADIKILATKIKNAWRVRKHRKVKEFANLSLGLEPDVALKLSRMSKGHKKNDIVKMLIQGNYEEFLKQKMELKLKRIESKKVRDQEKNYLAHQKLIVSPTDEIHRANTIERINKRKALAKKMIELLETANSKGVPISEEILMLATAIYENAA